jgi:hypothetical protein
MPRAIKAVDLTFLIVALTLMIVLASVSYLIAPPAGTDLRGSTYSSRSDGAKAVFLLLKQLGYTVERSFEPVAAVQAEPSETVLVLASPVQAASAQDRRALRAFLDRGGIVIATGAGAEFLPGMAPQATPEPPAARLATAADNDGPAPMPFHAAMPSPLTRGAPTLLFEPEIIGTTPTWMNEEASTSTGAGSGAGSGSGAGARAGADASAGARAGAPSTSSAYVGVYAQAAGPGVLTARFGDGRAIWAIGSTPFLNRDLDKPGHLEFLLNAIGPREEGRVVLWDEYYHGYSRGLVSYLASTNLSTAFAQLGLMALVALFTFSRRRGPLRPLVLPPRANAMEFVDAVSSLYQKAGAGIGAVETMRATLRRKLVAASQMPASASDAQLAAAAAVRFAIDEADVRDVLEASAAASESEPEKLPAAEALRLVQRMQAVAAKLAA